MAANTVTGTGNGTGNGTAATAGGAPDHGLGAIRQLITDLSHRLTAAKNSGAPDSAVKAALAELKEITTILSDAERDSSLVCPIRSITAHRTNGSLK
jgi:hypothetical protein